MTEPDVLDRFSSAVYRVVGRAAGRDTHCRTGFLLDSPTVPAELRPVLVTARSLRTAATSDVRLTIEQMDSTGGIDRPLVVTIPAAWRAWIDHPDPAFDLAVMPLGPIVSRVLAPHDRLPVWRPLSTDALLWPNETPATEVDDREADVIAALPDGRGIIAIRRKLPSSPQAAPPYLFLIDTPLATWSAAAPIARVARDGTVRVIGIASNHTATAATGETRGVGFAIGALEGLLDAAVAGWDESPP